MKIIAGNIYFVSDSFLQKVDDPKVVHELEKTAKKVIKLILRDIRFTPTQPNVSHI